MASVRVAARGLCHAEDLQRLCARNDIIKRVSTLGNRRNYCDNAVPPLNVPLSGMNHVKEGLNSRNDRLKSGGVQVTQLSNGVKVASEDSFGPFCTVGGMF